MPATNHLLEQTLPGPLGRLQRWSRANVLLVDVAWLLLWSPWTAILTFVGVLSALSVHGDTSVWTVLFSLAMVAGFTVPMAFRRTAPDAATVAIAVTHLVQLVALHEPTTGQITVPLFLYATARHGNRRLSRLWLALAGIGSVAAGLRWGLGWALPFDPVMAFINAMFITIGCAAISVAAWALGQWGHQREQTLNSLADRAEALERQHEQGLQLVVADERTRLAREMHDVVAHSLSVIVVQSDGAKYLAGTATGDPAERLAQVEKAIQTINTTARNALVETRRMVGVLRAEGEAAELAPAATLNQVEGLVAQLRDAGVPATLTVQGDPASHAALGSGAEMAAYRVVQESLTNALKHAGPDARIDVALSHSPAGLDIHVVDDGIGTTPSDGLGHGLVGMRERVSAWGGHVTAGPRPGGGWQVSAHLPSPSKDLR